jgi:hypothetical protein
LPAIAYHSANVVRQTMVLFGGATSGNQRLNNVYLVDLIGGVVDQLVVTVVRQLFLLSGVCLFNCVWLVGCSAVACLSSQRRHSWR